jgi:two-component system, NtrC family, sensor kinase
MGEVRRPSPWELPKRLLAWLAAAAGGALLVWLSVPAGLTALLLAVTVLVPLEPRQTLGAGLLLEALYLLSWPLGNSAEAGGSLGLLLLLLAVAATGISAALSLQRRADRQAREQAVQVAETLAAAKLQAQLAESAASIGKLAAALSHEINSPLGILKSSVDTLLVMEARQATAPVEPPLHLLEMQAQLRRAVQASSERLQDVVERLQRFSTLDEADLREADLNDLLRDVTLKLEAQLHNHVRLELACEPLPKLACRPQLLSTAFSTLLTNAIQALDGAAVNGRGRIDISTRCRDARVQVRIRDNGRGMTPEQLDNIFDPTFQIAGERVRSGNWSLFNSRQIVFEHGGDIQISSAVGQGTTVTVVLPCRSCEELPPPG